MIVSAILYGSCQLKVDSGSKKPHILFIAVDDLRPMLGCYGVEDVKSPGIDKLADQGIMFLNAFSQQAWCSPSRTSLLTGLRPDKTRVYDLVTNFRDATPNAITLPQFFKSNGYKTLAFGKIFHSNMDDTVSWSIPTWEPKVIDPLKHYVLSENIEAAKNRNGYATPYERANVLDDDYPDGQITAKAIEALEGMDGRPFFLAVGYYKPHLPFNAPAKYWEMYDDDNIDLPQNTARPIGSPEYAFLTRSEHHNYLGVPPLPSGTPLPDSLTRKLIHGYMACVSYVDAQVARLLQALEDRGELEHTIVVLWGDHGWKLGEYGSWSKHTNYDVDTKVPLIIKPSGKVFVNAKVKSIVELLDVYPTLVSLAGFEIPDTIEGKSLLSLIESGGNEENVAFSQFIRNQERNYTTYKDAEVIGQTVRTDQFRFIRWIDKKSPTTILATELYDLRKGEYEMINEALNEAYSEKIRALSELLDKNFHPEEFQGESFD
ncbi:MAG: sulfatase [Cyclobacteriaceae bacterium]|nr:sulfatase [Cyclobacteriaceae bacterium]